MSNPTIGFIGYGNMAQAIAEGLVAAGAIDGTDIVACAAHYDKLEKTTAKVGATPLRTAAEVADAADVVIIAIKPYQIESVIKPIAGALANESTFVVSIAPDTVNCSAPISARCTSSAPFRTRRWPSAKACSSRKPTTR